MHITVTIDDTEHTVADIPGDESLLHLLRDRVGHTATKNACEQGECGSCTVYLDEDTVCSCLVAAGQADGRRIRTAAGLATPALDPVQQAFLTAGAVQCGFCTPGLIVQTHALLAATPQPTDAEIRIGLAGNLCRCTGYEKILDAVRLAPRESTAL
ncbi:(2Fe-2S)-binding protein [Nocardia alni]|uniref:(2Fe-2S)-binding protein n=1 Tax=Nocardia alni TaxID=2815723 RepID=UPI001C2366B4|nr:(2Fe-2S)-binding protein [Nocardia alni]